MTEKEKEQERFTAHFSDVENDEKLKDAAKKALEIVRRKKENK